MPTALMVDCAANRGLKSLGQIWIVLNRRDATANEAATHPFEITKVLVATGNDPGVNRRPPIA